MADIRFEKLKKILEDEKGCDKRHRSYDNGSGNVFDFYYDFLCINHYPNWCKFKEDLRKDYFRTKRDAVPRKEEVADLEELFRIVDEI